MGIVLKRIEEQHLPFVKEVYDYYTLHTTAVYFTTCVTIEELRGYIPVGDDRYQSFLIETQQGERLGFCYFARFKPRQAFSISVELTIYLQPQYKGHGYGQQAMELIEPIIRQGGFSNIMALISADNKESIHLFERNGYECCANMKGVAEKFGRKLDLTIYQKRL